MRFNLWDTDFGDYWDKYSMAEAINSKINKREDITDNIEFWQNVNCYDNPYSYKLVELLPHEAKEIWSKQYDDYI